MLLKDKYSTPLHHNININIFMKNKQQLWPEITSKEMIFMVTLIYLAFNESVQKLTVHKIGGSCSENEALCKINLS